MLVLGGNGKRGEQDDAYNIGVRRGRLDEIVEGGLHVAKISGRRE